MFKKSLAIAILLNEIKASTTADDTFANTIAGCQAFAATFATHVLVLEELELPPHQHLL
jgi:hypothetical protein